MAEATHTFADVILPLALPGYFTYYVPEAYVPEIHPGKRVVVQFGRKRLYTAIVHSVHHQPPKGYAAKFIHEVIGEEAPVNHRQLQLWTWISEYYMCYPGEVYTAALPGGLRLSSETRITQPGGVVDEESLSDDEFLVYEALQSEPVLDVNAVQAILGKKEVHPLLRSMLEKGAVILEEELKEKYKPKMADYVQLHPDCTGDEKLSAVFEELSRAPKQEALLLSFIDLNARIKHPAGVPKNDLLKRAGASLSSLRPLIEKNVLRIFSAEVDRLPSFTGDTTGDMKLSPQQFAAVQSIQNHFAENRPVLLHGVTGSGKTEVYIRLIRDVLESGKQVLYLLPEIALTTQIIGRLQQHFGDKVAVYHSRLNEHERVEVWQQVRTGKKPLVLGARSSIFLPFDNLGLVVVDEEHETSFKQFDPAPRYHARDVALVLGQMHDANVVLGSATPSLESYRHATSGKYGYVEMAERFGAAVLPDMQVVNLAEAQHRKQLQGSFSTTLVEEIKATLDRGEQVILFQNRRGFSPFIECNLCGWVPQCTRCDVSLTYHKKAHHLRCHYCGYSIEMPSRCASCQSRELQTIGLGTERVEEEIALLFPDARTKRMDLDSTRAKHGHRNIIHAFEKQEIDILVGTQMVTKGLDFDHVGLVGVLNADHMMNVPEFRAFERAYQLMVQVSGRAGRKDKRGKVLIQTRTPEHQVVKDVLAHDYVHMATRELEERKIYGYPPFTRLVRLTLKHRQAEAVHAAAVDLAGRLHEPFGKRVLGPEPPAISRVRNFYLMNIMIKMEQKLPLKRAKEVIGEIIESFSNEKSYRNVRIVTDVDPV